MHKLPAFIRKWAMQVKKSKHEFEKLKVWLPAMLIMMLIQVTKMNFRIQKDRRNYLHL